MSTDKIIDIINNSHTYPTKSDLQFVHDIEQHVIDEFIHTRQNIEDSITLPVSLQGLNLHITNTMHIQRRMHQIFTVYKENELVEKLDYKLGNIRTNPLILEEIEHLLTLSSINIDFKSINKYLREAKFSMVDEKSIEKMVTIFEFMLHNDITRDNLDELHGILLNSTVTYRDNDLEVIHSAGIRRDINISHTEVYDKINDIITFIGDKQDDEIEFLKPFIVQYYLMILQPFERQNDLLSRLISYWSMLSSECTLKPKFIFSSLAMYNRIERYFDSFQYSKDLKHDLTSFIENILDSLYSHTILYSNYYKLQESIKFTKTQLKSLRVILHMHNCEEELFDAKKYESYFYSRIDNKAHLKALNKLEEKGLLNSEVNTTRTKFFSLKEHFGLLKYTK